MIENTVPNSDCSDYNIRPILPGEVERYTRHFTLRKDYTDIAIKPFNFYFDSPKSPPGWSVFAHPEGARYFYHSKKKIYTDSNVYDEKVRDRIEDSSQKLQIRCQQANIQFPDDMNQVVINIDEETSERRDTTYYYTDHQKRVVFFAEPYMISWSTKNPSNMIMGPKSYRHLGYEMQAEYWNSVYMYPSCLTLTTSMISELRDIVLHLIGDTMSSPASPAPYSLEYLFRILSLTSEMEKNAGLPGAEGSMGLLARYMHLFYGFRFVVFHGEPFAHLSRGAPVFSVDHTTKRSWMTKAASYLMFFAPDVHLTERMREIRTGPYVNISHLEEKLKQLSFEWNDYILLSTVMLTVNVSFLAIQSVDSTTTERSPAQIASYVSTSLSFASIATGTLMQNYTKREHNIENIRYLLNKWPSRGPEVLSILYSLPYALLLWGMLAFVVAFSVLCFNNSSSSTRGIVGFAYGLVAFLLVMLVLVFQDRHKPREVVHEEYQFPKSLGGNATVPPASATASESTIDPGMNLPPKKEEKSVNI